MCVCVCFHTLFSISNRRSPLHSGFPEWFSVLEKLVPHHLSCDWAPAGKEPVTACQQVEGDVPVLAVQLPGSALEKVGCKILRGPRKRVSPLPFFFGETDLGAKIRKQQLDGASVGPLFFFFWSPVVPGLGHTGFQWA